MSGVNAAPVPNDAGAANWTTLIDEIVADSWFNPELGKVMKVDYDSIVFQETLDGGEADLDLLVALGRNGEDPHPQHVRTDVVQEGRVLCLADDACVQLFGFVRPE